MQELSKQKGKTQTLYRGALLKKNEIGTSWVLRFLQIDEDNLY